jgi:hypothetical protein
VFCALFWSKDSCFVDRLLGVNPSLDGKLKCALSGTYFLDASMGARLIFSQLAVALWYSIRLHVKYFDN